MTIEDDKRAQLLRDGPSGPKRRGPRRKPSSPELEKPKLETSKTSSNLVLISEKEELPEEARDVIFRPNPGPQTDFLSATEQEVLFGGAAGGGKSYAILADAARYLYHPDFKGLIVRRTTEELRELIYKSQEMYPRIYPGIKWSERKMEWYFPSGKGGRIWMSYLDRDQDVTKYQGQAFTYIAFDELTQWPSSFCWTYLRSRLRSDNSQMKLYMRATSNPGGVGHHWVKKMFVDPAPWGQAFWARDEETGEVLEWPKGHSFTGPLFKRRFIPSKLKDNPYLYSSGQYEANLLSLPEHQRRQLLEGDWDIVSGAAFPEWNRDLHVIKPFHIPSNWRRFRSCDYGYGSFSAVAWFAVHPDGQLIVYDELYVKKVLAKDLANIILDREADHKISYGVLDSSCWAQRGDTGPSIAETMIQEGCRWRPADRSKGSRKAGKNEFHRRLQVDEFTGQPRLVFFNTCTNAIALIPTVPLDPDNPEDVDTDAEDHMYDAVRYGLMSRPKRGIFEQGSNLLRKTYQPVDEVFGY
jgi:hypothetical protein